MYLFHSTVRCRSGQADSYEQRTVSATAGILKAKGFIRRILLRSQDDRDVFFYISIWESEELLQAYRSSDFVTQWKDGRTLDVLSESVTRVVCDLVVDETAAPDAT